MQKCEISFLSCLCYTSVKINKVAALPFFSSLFAKKLSFFFISSKDAQEKDLQYEKVWQFRYRNCSSQQRWQIRCLMESGIPAVLCIPSCCVVSPPSLCLQTSSDLPRSSVSCLSFFLKKKKKEKKIDCFERKHVATMCTRMHGHAAG